MGSATTLTITGGRSSPGRQLKASATRCRLRSPGDQTGRPEYGTSTNPTRSGPPPASAQEGEEDLLLLRSRRKAEARGTAWQRLRPGDHEVGRTGARGFRAPRGDRDLSVC